MPSDARGAYPNLTLGHTPGRPLPDSAEARDAARIFQLRPREARQIIERLRAVFSDVPTVMDLAGLDDRDRRLLERVIWRPGRN